MTRTAVVLAAFLVVGCRGGPEAPSGALADEPVSALAAAFGGSAGSWIDLTHTFSSATIYWPTDTLGFVHEELAYGPDPGGWFYSAYRYSAAEHGGTHLDAPIHFAEGGHASDEIPLSNLVGAAVVVDVSDRAHPDYLLSIEDLTSWEAEHGPIPDGAILLVRTGWGSRYSDRTAYLGTARTGPDAVAELHFPGVAPEAAQWLVDNRSLKAIGIDTPSLDYGQSPDFASHVILYAEDIPGFENVANLEQLPAVGSFVVALPMKIAGGSGGPLRIVAYIPGTAAVEN
jgi:kynurenine formamidase